jgi:hypothetical protein
MIIRNPHFFFSSNTPDLKSKKFISIIKEFSTSYWSQDILLLIIAVVLFFLATNILLPSLLPKEFLAKIHYPWGPGKVTKAGIIFCLIILTISSVFINRYRTLAKDRFAYKYLLNNINDFEVLEAQPVSFSSAEVGGRNYSNRITWKKHGKNIYEGTSPLIRTSLSFWVDFDDSLWIAIDKTNKGSPVFLGVKKSLPQLRSFSTFSLLGKKDIDHELKIKNEFMISSTRWKNYKIVHKGVGQYHVIRR